MEKLANTTTKLALVSKEADKIGRERRTWENKTENNTWLILNDDLKFINSSTHIYTVY